jgi:hypothetical protein
VTKILARLAHKDSRDNDIKIRYLTCYQVKIWITPDSCNEPLGFSQNEQRIINEREKNPHHSIRLVYEPKQLSNSAKSKLTRLSENLSIELMTLDDIEEELRSQQGSSITEDSANLQLKLLKIAKEESTNPDGCLAAASDILRTLTPVLQVKNTDTGELVSETRLYTDFDTKPHLELPKTIEVQEDSLLMADRINNALFCPNPEGLVMQQIRRNIYKNYQIPVGMSLLRACFGARQKIDESVSETPLNSDLLLFEPLTYLQEELQKSNLEQIEVIDVYALRKVLKMLINHTSGDIKDFWLETYKQLTIQTSGPEAYSAEPATKLTAHYDYGDFPLIDLNFRCEQSWVPGFVAEVGINVKNENTNAAKKTTSHSVAEKLINAGIWSEPPKPIDLEGELNSQTAHKLEHGKKK